MKEFKKKSNKSNGNLFSFLHFYQILMNGRPRYAINRDFVQEYRNAGLRWIDISELMNISQRTLSRQWMQNNFEVMIAI